MSSIYGTNAFFGIINIVSLEADKAPRAYGRGTLSSYGVFGGNLRFGYGDVIARSAARSRSKRIGESVTYNDFSQAMFNGETDADQAEASAARSRSTSTACSSRSAAITGTATCRARRTTA